MFVGISNTPRDYAWGSPSAIAALLGRPASGGPEAELWLGAHPGSPSVIADPALTGGAATLTEWIDRDPAAALGAAHAGSARLPFLMKILAAHSPLSLQAHPSPDRAAAGFALENAAGIPIDAADRNYRDPFHKPEIIFALSDTFQALCGFRDPRQIRSILAELRALDATMDDPQPAALLGLENRLVGDEAIHDVVDWLLRDGRGGDTGEVSWLVERVVTLAEQAAFLIEGGARVSFAAEFDMVRSLSAAYPGDPGIVISLLTNLVSLKRGEVLFLPAGNIHAYLSGLGVEVMAASDNVLRGGLSPKHIDVDELLDVLDFAPLPVPYLAPELQADGVAVYRPDVPDFELAHISVPADASTTESGQGGVPMRQVTLTGPAIAICTAGRFLVAGATSSISLARGESVYITPDEGTVTFAGSGEVFLATTP
ncbi:mannose-6-phosphate isomerase, class I [Cryobacterium sp. SO1]|uniref:mannose-6-phosphate isomerase, class I n=1 Tax=Cryobacterium sp. SO1 TaxID=1897061 RepID=UPI0010231C99|nr:mannose-6-phosphate isomerase, class I [Cryobacterium sp. SO1]RZI35183.1 Mannose-6-phosphate isomerase [Cryobacterium sp. SO1]